MKRGTCKLCLEDKMLCDSHLAPAGLHKYCKTIELGPVKLTAREITVMDKEVSDYVLCEQCEERLNHDGENWLLPKLATIDKSFPFFDLLMEVPPDTAENGVYAFACSRNPKVGFRKLTNFAIGVFWKASVHSWGMTKGGPVIRLGKYSEELRRFLVCKARFPKAVTLVIGVTPPENAPIGFVMPWFRGVGAFHQYIFYVPGVLFVLSVGNRIANEDKQLCFYSAPLHPIIVADFSSDIFSMVKRNTKNALHSKDLTDFISKRSGK